MDSWPNPAHSMAVALPPTMAAIAPCRLARRQSVPTTTGAKKAARRSARRLLERIHDSQSSELLTVLQILGEQDGTIARTAAATIMESQIEYRYSSCTAHALAMRSGVTGSGAQAPNARTSRRASSSGKPGLSSAVTVTQYSCSTCVLSRPALRSHSASSHAADTGCFAGALASRA